MFILNTLRPNILIFFCGNKKIIKNHKYQHISLNRIFTKKRVRLSIEDFHFGHLFYVQF